MAPVTDPARPVTVLVSHGSPSDPDPQEAFIAGMARRVEQSSGVETRGATLAKTGSLEAAVAGLDAPLIYPLFMTDGWFVSTALQNRLKASGLARWRTGLPFGMQPGLPDLTLQRLRSEMAQRQLPKRETTLVLAAHGSPSDPRPARATRAFGATLEASRLFRAVRIGFVDEAPSLEEAARVHGPALVLPFFAARAGHVLTDLPEALDSAGFEGPVLDPIGAWEDVPELIASSRNELAEAS